MKSVCRLVRTSGNQENECELVKARSVYVDQYAINESDQEEELNKAKPDSWKMIWPKWDLNEKMKHSIDQNK